MLVHIIRLKVTREKDAAFPYYFVPGFKTKLPIVDPCVNFFLILPRLSGSLHDHKCVQKINLLLVNQINVLSNDGAVDCKP